MIRRRAFTMIEMLTTVAVLIIILGLMVSLAQHVRDRSSQQLTRELLRQVDGMMEQYYQRNHQLPNIAEFIDPTVVIAPTDESPLAEAAVSNNGQFVAALKQDARRSRRDRSADPVDPFDQLPLGGIYDHRTLRDAWGSPIVFMPGQHPLIGLAPSRDGQDQFFFFSAGPDQKYLTRDDNLYSYEGPRPLEPAE